MNWYVLVVRGGMEEKIRDFFLSQGLHAFIKKMKVVFRKQGIFELIEKIMFPGYLFIESELEQAAMEEQVKELRMQKTGIVMLSGKNKVLEYSTG